MCNQQDKNTTSLLGVAIEEIASVVNFISILVVERFPWLLELCRSN